MRLAPAIMEHRAGTCLDLSVLFAACLEQAGIHPLVVVVAGHAFPGVWLYDNCFQEATVEDGASLLNRVRLQEIRVFEAVSVTARPPLSFREATVRPAQHLDPLDSFVYVIDIKRARRGGIRPLPVLSSAPTAIDPVDQPVVAPPLRVPAAGPAAPTVDDEPPSAPPPDRLVYWKRKLLDLSAQNRLLHARQTQSVLPLLSPGLGALQQALLAGHRFEIQPTPKDLTQTERDSAMHKERTATDLEQTLALEELRSRRLYAKQATPEALTKNLLRIYRQARLSLEENGANTLFLALGFLHWYDQAGIQPRKAPVWLIPLVLDRRSAKDGFMLRQADDEPEVNVTLLEMLRQDYGIVPELDGLARPESEQDIDALLHQLRRAIRDKSRWQVVDETWIDLFFFTKFRMWRDLDELTDDLDTNPVVHHLLHHPGEAFDTDGSFTSEEDLDGRYRPDEVFCPLESDASQLAAVLEAANGRTFVLHGPPGTSKSQTITNIIAHNVAHGRSVFFVSEKAAALDVVYQRLAACGLGPFCLALHSNKSSKREVLQQLQEALNAGSETPNPPAEWEHLSDQIQTLRQELNSYVEELHRPRPLGESLFRCLSRRVALEALPALSLGWSDPGPLDHRRMAELRNTVDRLADANQRWGGVAGHLFAGAGTTD